MSSDDQDSRENRDSESPTPGAREDTGGSGPGGDSPADTSPTESEMPAAAGEAPGGAGRLPQPRPAVEALGNLRTTKGAAVRTPRRPTRRRRRPSSPRNRNRPRRPALQSPAPPITTIPTTSTNTTPPALRRRSGRSPRRLPAGLLLPLPRRLSPRRSSTMTKRGWRACRFSNTSRNCVPGSFNLLLG